MRRKRITMIMVILLLLLTKGSGLYRDLLVVLMYGTSTFTDGYFLALSLVLTLYALIGKGITLFLIPMLTGEDEDYGIITNFVLKAWKVVIPVILIYLIVPLRVIRFFYSGNASLLKPFFDIAIVTLFCVPCLYVLVAFHQKRERFYTTTLLGLVFNLSLISFSLLGSRDIVPYSFLAGTVLQLGLLILYRFDVKKVFSCKTLMKIEQRFGVFFWIVLAVSFEQLLVMEDRTFISAFGEGKLSMLDLGGKFSFLFMGIIVLGLTTIIYPKLTQLYQQGLKKQAVRLIEYCMLMLLVVSISIIVLIQWKGDWVLGLIFKAKTVNYTEIGMYLQYYSWLIIPLSIREMLMRLLILEKREKQLALYSLIGLGSNWLISSWALTERAVIMGTIIGVVITTLCTSVDYIRQVRLFR